MNRYRFEAADATGKIESGHLEADSQGAAFGVLRSRGLTALSVHKESNVAQHGGGSGLFSARMSDNDLAWATRQLASLLGPVCHWRRRSARRWSRPRKTHRPHPQRGACRRAQRHASGRIAGRTATGFSGDLSRVDRCGEESGDLAQVMERLADYIEERNNLRGKILTAFIYPGVVGLVSIGIVIFLLSYVVPQVVSAFSQARQDLPG